MAHETAAFHLPPSNATSSSAVSTFANNFQEGLSRNAISCRAGGRQGLQSDRQSSLQGTSYSSILGLEAFVCVKGGESLTTINPVCNIILFY